VYSGIEVGYTPGVPRDRIYPWGTRWSITLGLPLETPGVEVGIDVHQKS